MFLANAVMTGVQVRTSALQVVSRISVMVVTDFDAWKKELEYSMRRENGRQDLKVLFDSM